jgi:hypothetical protein
MNEISVVWADLPNCGLGNKLLIWGKASWYAKCHELPLMTTGWDNSIGLMTWWRGGGWRRYGGDFKRLSWAEQKWLRNRARCGCLEEPEIDAGGRGQALYRFHQVPHWSDYFGRLHDGREYLRATLPTILSDKRRAEIQSLPSIPMAVHVRLGDFQVLKPGQSFADVGQTRTPLDYFIEIIENVRSLVGRNIEVTVFSDGPDDQLAGLLRLPAVNRAPAAPAIIDMYRMAKAQLLVCAAGSTFSYWSAFLGDQPTILHRDHIHRTIRPVSMGSTLFEGGVMPHLEDWPELLIANIQARFS